jgi:flagellar basal-body rod protein FlgC
MSLYGSITLSSQGLSVQRQRMEVISSNLANIGTTQTPEGGAYRRRQLIVEAIPKSDFEQQLDGFMNNSSDEQLLGVRSTQIRLDSSPLLMKYEPDHPHADPNGYVAYPNVNPSLEMVDMVSTSRSYEANLTAVRSAREMITSTIELLRG